MIDNRKTGLIAGFLIATGIVLLWASGIVGIKTDHVTIRNRGAKLAATLATPRFGAEPFPAVVVVHGSGRVRRDDLRGYVRKLVPEGFAVLYFDKRGVGKSTGVFTNVTVPNSDDRLRELAEDVSVAVDFLREHPDVDGERIGLIGGSQAGWIMPITAVSNQSVSFFVVMSGPAVTFGQEIFYSQLTGDDPGPYGKLTDEEIATSLAGFGGPDGYDPRPVLGEVNVPSLWLLGENDRSVPTQATVENLHMIDSKGIFDVRVIQGTDHDLRDVDSGERYDYWEDILAWLREEQVLDGGQSGN